MVTADPGGGIDHDMLCTAGGGSFHLPEQSLFEVIS
jgi:hypothetical protein